MVEDGSGQVDVEAGRGLLGLLPAFQRSSAFIIIGTMITSLSDITIAITSKF